MTQPTYTEAFLRQRKFYLFLPVLALPFLTFIYWKLVVKNLERHPGNPGQDAGLQLRLPSPDLSGENSMDKLAYYRRADQDSANWAQQIKKDPYRNDGYVLPLDSSGSALMGLAGAQQKQKSNLAYQTSSAKRHLAQEEQVQQRLLALDKALTSAQSPAFESHKRVQDAPDPPPPSIDKFEKMMAGLQDEDLAQAEDPEMARLDSMLDKLLQLQDPERASQEQAQKATQNQEPALAVSTARPQDYISLLSGAGPDSVTTGSPNPTQTGFYGLDDEQPEITQPEALTAVVETSQQLVSGSTVQLRLTRDLWISSFQIPANTLLYGTASLSGERLKIKVSSLRSLDQILPVSLSVYDLDGIEGIYIPGALSRTVAKQQLGSQVQGLDLDASGFSAGAQAASAGIQMGKMLLGRKARLIEVTLPHGYKVLLRDTNTTNQ
jgi:conjugative transposon TraM protein